MNPGDMAYAMMVALGISGLAIDGVVRLIPHPATADLFEVHSIRAVRDGDSANLWVDRTIKVPVQMSFVVRVQEWTPAGWRQTCIAPSDPFLYQPDAVMDQPVTLSWWTNGDCPTLPPGRTRIVTTWTPHVLDTLPVSYSVEVEG